MIRNFGWPVYFQIIHIGDLTALILSTKLKNELLRKVSSAPRDVKLFVGLLEGFNKELLSFKTQCAFPTKHRNYRRVH